VKTRMLLGLVVVVPLLACTDDSGEAVVHLNAGTALVEQGRLEECRGRVR
jgi:hypothetical protein